MTMILLLIVVVTIIIAIATIAFVTVTVDIMKIPLLLRVVFRRSVFVSCILLHHSGIRGDF